MRFDYLKKDRHLQILILILAVYFGFWVGRGINNYRTYSEGYYDIGIYTYSLYWHLHFAQNINPLVYLSTFANHTSLIIPLLLPIFYLYQNPVTLYVIQGVFLALTAVLVYVVSRDLTKKRDFSFLLSIAFILNPGVTGLLYSASHLEAFIPFFYILSFYAYVKRKTYLFAASMVLLLSVMETTFALAFTLLAGLLVYEVLHARNYESKSAFGHNVVLLGVGLAITVFFACFYYATAITVPAMLANTSQSVVPPIIRPINSISIAMSHTIGLPEGVLLFILVMGCVGVLYLLFGFGVSSLADPFITLILLSPWFFEVFVLEDYAFLYPWRQYYANFVGPSLTAALLGYLIISKYKGKMLGIIPISPKNIFFKPQSLFVLIIIMIFPFVGYVANTVIGNSTNVNYVQIGRALSLIPANTSVLAQSPIAAHLYYIKELELSSADNPIHIWKANVTVTWFTPQYIVIDRNLMRYSGLVNSTGFNLYDYMGRNYTIYYNKSGLYIFRHT